MTVKINVIVQKVTSPLPTGVTFDHTDITVTDAANAVSTQAVGAAPWSAQFDIEGGGGSVIATDIDSEGNAIGTPAGPVFFNTDEGNFPSSVGITVAIVPVP